MGGPMGTILGQTFGTRKPAFLAGSQPVPKLTLCETVKLETQ